MRLSYQINLRILLSSVLILLVGCALTLWHAKNAIHQEINASVNLTNHLITCGLSQTMPNDTSWLNCFNSLQETRHLKIELVKPSGEILTAGTKNNQIALENPPPQWFVSLIGKGQVKSEQKLTTPVGEQFSLRIQANPLDEIKEIWLESMVFFGMLLLLTQLTFLSVYLALKKSIKSINSIVDALHTIETGNYQLKLPEFITTEYNSIAKAINHMTGELNQAEQANRALTQHSLKILENERKQLAQELHDELGQTLTAIKIMAVTATRTENDIKPMMTSIAGHCDDLINVVRTMMQQLHPLALTELGLKAALEDLIARWAGKQTGVSFHLECPDEIEHVGQNITIQVFRVIQECITNIVRHADANEAYIRLQLDNNPQPCLRLSVKDNGKGCAAEQLKNGFGILGMKERIHSLGGQLTLQTQPKHGMEISANIPRLNCRY